MNAWHRSAAALAGLLASMVCHGAWAAPRSVEPFAAGTWSALQAGLKLPAVVVFTTTDCTHCPATIAQLTSTIDQRKLKAYAIVVVMDMAPGDSDDELLRHAHYRQVDRLFAFAGQAQALRYTVDPRWRGVTPYVMFLSPKAPARAVTGPPSTSDVQVWMRTFPAR